MKAKIRVLIIEDSETVRALLEDIVGRDPRLEVAASVGSAEEGLKALHRARPDVISLDIRLPGMDGFQATRRIMAERPTPIVVVSASVEKEDLAVSIKALEAGALAILEKPVGATRDGYRRLAEQLCTQLAIMSEVKVVRQRRPLAPGRGPLAPGRGPLAPGRGPLARVPAAVPRAAWDGGTGGFRALGVAASTGGPSALERLLGGLGAGFPLPILLVQHITPSFLAGFADWLDGACPFAVAIAKEGELPAAGRVYLAPADAHLTMRAGRIRLDPGRPVSSQRPSATPLFESLAAELGPKAMGVVLTGMGDDGAQGLLELRAAGGYTIAEDESTAVVYGMPRAAARLGAASESLPLDAIPRRILELALGSEDGDSRGG